MTGLVAAWQAGDPDGVLAVARKYDDKIAGAGALEERFIWSRHDAMRVSTTTDLRISRRPSGVIRP